MFNYSARPELLKERIILVTGAGRGIGAAAAKTYAAHGATVLLLGKTEANLTAIYDEIEAAGHPQPAVIPFDLETALPHQYDELAAMIETEFGRLDGLLHNASIIGPRTPIELLSGEHFMRVMHINVNAMFMLTAALLPLLKLSQDASVVFTSSSVGRKGRAYWGAYGVSKFATEGLMQTLAEQPDARRDHAGVPVPDGAGQFGDQWPGVRCADQIAISYRLRPPVGANSFAKNRPGDRDASPGLPFANEFAPTESPDANLSPRGRLVANPPLGGFPSPLCSPSACDPVR
jgi:NADP-dependent 3-hydroxy acid dehydrogenase YdfG